MTQPDAFAIAAKVKDLVALISRLDPCDRSVWAVHFLSMLDLAERNRKTARGMMCQVRDELADRLTDGGWAS